MGGAQPGSERSEPQAQGAQGLGGGDTVSLQLTKSEIIRNLSLSIKELGLHDTVGNVHNLSCGAPQLD